MLIWTLGFGLQCLAKVRQDGMTGDETKYALAFVSAPIKEHVICTEKHRGSDEETLQGSKTQGDWISRN